MIYHKSPYYKKTEYKRVVVNFSCGAASACALKLAVEEFGVENVHPVYQVTNSEHPDNERFLKDVEKWCGVTIEKQQHPKYHDIWEVFDKVKYLVGIMGAPCTRLLKREVAQSNLDFFNDLEVFGYTSEEVKRILDFIERNEERRIYANLASGNGLDKNACYAMLLDAGIELPAMYLLGYRNNNCIGCVKGGMGYWNKIRVDFPNVFARMAKLEKKLGAAICAKFIKKSRCTPEQIETWYATASPKMLSNMKKKEDEGKEPNLRFKVYLDELDPTAGNYKSEPSISCGVMCEKDQTELNFE